MNTLLLNQANLAMQQQANIDHYAVLGNPIHHSKSPLIHRFFAQQTSQRMTYSAILIPEYDQLADVLSDFYQNGGKGVNITAPFKQIATSLVDSVSEKAKQAQAINTIKWDAKGHRYGDNTDGVGFIRDLTQHKAFNLVTKRILLLGAGGALLGILGPLLEQGPADVVICNRTEYNAKKRVEAFCHLGNISACALSNLHGSFDLIVNTTNSDSFFFDQLSPSILHPNTLCYDINYANQETPFLKWAKEAGADQLYDGLGMLIEQAAESFYLWRGIKPDTRSLLTMDKKIMT